MNNNKTFYLKNPQNKKTNNNLILNNLNLKNQFQNNNNLLINKNNFISKIKKFLKTIDYNNIIKTKNLFLVINITFLLIL